MSPTAEPLPKNELTKFILAEKCASPALRQFEVNLYLAEKWFLPLQELYQPEQLKEPSPKIGNPTDKQPAATKRPQPAVKKAKPAVKKKQAKPPAKKDPFKGVVIPGRQ